MQATEQTGTRRLLRLPEVRQRVGLSRTEIYRRIKRNTFPSPVRLGPQSRAWDSAAIDRWIEDCLQSSKAVRQ